MAATFGGPVHGAAADAVFAALLVAACVSDVRTRRIPQRLVGAIAVLGIGYSIVEAPWLAGSAHALGGLGVGLAMWLPFYLARVLGAGDVKFFAAASIWLGASSAVLAALLAAVCGAVLSVTWIMAPRRPAARPLPYAIAMAAGLGLSAWLPRLPL